MSDANMTDYECTYRSFRLDVPEEFNYARDVADLPKTISGKIRRVELRNR